MSSDGVLSASAVAAQEIITLSDDELEDGEVVDDGDTDQWTCDTLSRDDGPRSDLSDGNRFHRCDICGVERSSKTDLYYHKSRGHRPLVSLRRYPYPAATPRIK